MNRIYKFFMSDTSGKNWPDLYHEKNKYSKNNSNRHSNSEECLHLLVADSTPFAFRE